jgi:dolichol kinase
MLDGEILWNCCLMLLCYAYITVLILASGRIDRLFHVSVKASRKFLHMMIGNLVFAIPFFTSGIFPVLVAAPFVLVTFLVSPYSPFPNIGRKLTGLAGITEEGHRLGLLFYSLSYTVLALIFAARPYVIAAGILPMAYGDAAASIVGERYGRRGFRVFARKSLEGSERCFLLVFSVSLSAWPSFPDSIHSRFMQRPLQSSQ